MTQDKIKAVVIELQDLLECYRHLSLLNNQSAAKAGKSALYNRMNELLHLEEVETILLQAINYPFEDYIYHVEDDTQEFIDVLIRYMDNMDNHMC